MTSFGTPPTIYPIGYSTRYAVQRTDDLMQDPKTLLIDTRFRPTSQLAQWRKPTLERVYGKRYRWAGEYLGNVNYNNELPIELADPEPGITRLVEYLQQGYRLILLCQCPDFWFCHRKVIVDRVLKALPTTRVIQPETLSAVEGYRCLSIQQPYGHWLANQALFIENGLPPKLLENRDWRTRYRGEILLHASATFDWNAFTLWKELLPGLDAVVPMERRGYVQGAIIGIAHLVDVLDASDDVWFCGKYGFVLKNARPIGPIPYPGALKLFEVPRSVVGTTLFHPIQ